MIRFLSYPYEKRFPVYGNSKATLQIKSRKSLAKGDSCYVYGLRIENHWGTHVDCPAHFFKKGVSSLEFSAADWCFQTPQVISLKLVPGELLSWSSHLKTKIKRTTDLLLFKSGWFRYRLTHNYVYRNPGIHPEFGLHLRRSFPNIRAIGFDWISATSYVHRKEGRIAHRNLLNPKGPGAPVRIIEDMDLSGKLEALTKVFALPLRVQGIDSAPCTILGEFHD